MNVDVDVRYKCKMPQKRNTKQYNRLGCVEASLFRWCVLLSFQNLQAHLGRFAGQYDQLVAFKPTGWTFSQKVDVVQDIQPYTSSNISIYGASQSSSVVFNPGPKAHRPTVLCVGDVSLLQHT